MVVKHSYLCVGGPEAGKRYAKYGDRPYFQVTLSEPMPAPMNYPLQEPTNIKQVVYVRQQWMADKETVITLWVPEKQTPLETMELLLETYEIYRKRS